MPFLFAFFLASSWTWCIGMYLPILLVRDYGAAGWWVFAVPNVIGAAAMGWILRDRNKVKEKIVSREDQPAQVQELLSDSHSITRDHFFACALFSLVTIAFHAFFMPWKFGWPGMIAVAPALVLSLFVRKDIDACVAALLTWLISAGVLVYLATHGQLAAMTNTALSATPDNGGLDLASIAALALPCTLGFLLCPYLDLTFHRARQALSHGQSKLAFTLGFGALFLLMVAATPLYASLLEGNGASAGAKSMVLLLLVHLSMQCVLTVALHARAIAGSGIPPTATLAAVVVGFAAFGVSHLLPDQARLWPGLSSGEVVYRVFMSFYGLIAPAYVLLVILAGRKYSTFCKRNFAICTAAIAIAMPFYWIGFIGQQMVWVVPGVLVVLIAWLFTRASLKAVQ